MITNVRTYTPLVNPPTLLLDDSGSIDTDLIQIRNITGLDPVKATINTTAFANIDGAAYTGKNVPSRNIVLTIGPNPDWVNWTVESLRKLIYLYFLPSQSVQLVFEDDVLDPVTIFGYVESCTANQFSKDPEFQVSIICPYPYFTSLNPIVLTGRTVNTFTPQTITYNGDIASGIQVEVDYHAGQTVPNSIEVQTTDPTLGNFFTVAATEEVDTHQKFMMSSVAGSKYVDGVRIATATVVSLLSKVQTSSQWPLLVPGDNKFSVITDVGLHDWTLTYYERFGGL